MSEGKAIELKVEGDAQNKPESSVNGSNQEFAHRRNPVTLEWRNLDLLVDLSVKQREHPEVKQKHILRGVSGFAEAGKFLAIMGASGAGKTTLLNVLSGRQRATNTEHLTGDILVNGVPIDYGVFKQHAAYVMQDDILMETLTPRESLSFSAQLRLPRDTPAMEKRMRVERIIKELGLEKCADTIVGSVLRRGISGGERKRASIGVELITDPGLLFVDEPTSGLDSSTALHVVQTLKKLTQSGRTVICTIHQPSSDIFALFDGLLLLVAGKVIFFDKAEKAVDYFKELGYPCPTFSNPADYFMQVMNGDAQKEAILNKFTKQVDPNPQLPFERAQLKPLVKSNEHRPSMLSESVLLAQRAWKNYARIPLTFKVRLIQNIFLGFLSGLIYLNLGKDQRSIQDRNGLLFFVCMTNTMTSVMSVVVTFPSERALFLREKTSNMYRTITYFLSKTISEFPFQILFPFLYSVITYWLSGLQPHASNYFTFFAAIFLLNNVGQSLGLLLGSSFTDSQAAVAVTPLVMIPFMLFSGFMVNSDNIPKYFIWLQYVSPIKYTYEIVLINEYKNLDLKCTDAEKARTNGVCPYTSGQQVLSALSVPDDIIGRNFAILVGLFIGFRIFAFLALRALAKAKVN